ncbi:MAG: adenine phosphoribosyltransferase [Kiritimatiellae bacterium]|nr:adenine phosphoribosyltransferase [Kiritimatiellia bacterium]
MAKSVADYVIDVKDYPKPGIIFRDITGILADAEGFRLSIDSLEEAVKGMSIDKVAAIEARGFIFGAPLADRLGVSFIAIRKPGKLPRETISESYTLEYGTSTVHIQMDAVKPGERVLVVDDLLATGGTAAAAARLVEREGGKVAGMAFVLELAGFEARKGALAGYDVKSIVRYDGK